MKVTASSYEKAAHETLRRAHEMCERRVAAAVATEREACEEIAGKWQKMWTAIERTTWDEDKANEAKMKAEAIAEVVNAIHARGGRTDDECEGRP